jgi:Ca-activated chloride channel family protein
MPIIRPHPLAHRPTPILVTLLALTAVLAVPAMAQTHPEPPPLTSLDSVAAGELLRRTDLGWIPLPVADIRVDLTVTGMMVQGRVSHSFVNPTDETIEVLYAYPMPDLAAVYSMEMRIGDRRIRSHVREKKEARRTYEAAKSTGRKAALVEQHRPNLFTTAAANINSGEKVTVILEYFEEARYVSGAFTLRLPLTYRPRFTAGDAGEAPREHDPRECAVLSAVSDVHDPRTVPVAELSVVLRPGFPLESVASTSHAVEVQADGDGYAIRPKDGRVVADRDFVLSWAPELEARPRSAVFTERRGDDEYALILLLPPLEASEAGFGLPTETLFIVDVSGSMQGPSIHQAREALLAALDRLRPEDRFNLIRFNDGNQAFRSAFVQAEGAELEEARDWVRGLQAGGGTMIHPALTRGLAMAGESRSSAHQQRIVFLTDGAVGDEQKVLRTVVSRIGEVRLHALGIGNAPNGYLMRKMASLGHGLCEFISASDSARNRIDEFFGRLDRPVMSSLDLRWNGSDLDDLLPERLPDLHAGEPLLVSARLGAGAHTGRIELGGHTREGWVDVFADLDDAVAGPGIAVRWARARVETLMDRLHEGVEESEVRAEVVALGLDHHLVTRYTSLVAVEEVSSALGPSRSVRMAAALPLGGTWNAEIRRWGITLAALGLALLLVARAWVRW